ncbi:MAG: aspartate/glutamate racemase family protein, partial [Kiritimatiellae bacterium]|nr:aspartate/glutamate racemase family protein [Kiritimatiellia bacterium]
PYGEKSDSEIISLARSCTATLLDMGVHAVVVACNTATAAAIDTLRAEHPSIPFVGMEPAIKVAASRTESGIVGVLATAGTFRGRLWRETCRKYAKGVEIVKSTAPEFVQIVESGEIDSPLARDAVERRIAPLLAAGADEIVLGCTHFPFLKGAMERIAGDSAEIIDPSAAVARQVQRIVQRLEHSAPDTASLPPQRIFLSTGEAAAFRTLVEKLAFCE